MGVAASSGLPFPLGFFHGLSGVEKERSDHSLPPSPLWVPELQRRLGSGNREALTWWRANEAFSFLHEKQFPSLKVTERKAMGCVWVVAKGREWRNANWKETVGKNVKPLHLCTPLCPFYEVITPNHIHPSWEKKKKSVCYLKSSLSGESRGPS